MGRNGRNQRTSRAVQSVSALRAKREWDFDCIAELKAHDAAAMGLSFREILDLLPSEPLLDVGALPFKKVGSGKVREIFDAGNGELLIIATDRLSAFDVVMPDGIAGKGMLLTQISLHWFGRTIDVVPNHLVSDHDARIHELLRDRPDLIPWSMLVRKLKPLPIEAVVRAYLAGSGWKSYKSTGMVFGQAAPAGLAEGAPLPQPYFTPTTKAQSGHDESISLAQCAGLLGSKRADEIEYLSFALFARGAETARSAGLILADTKFEFGVDEAGQVHLIDEVLTPDSSRFWPASSYVPGRAQHAFDKQFVRDYLETLSWDKSPPGPQLPQSVIEQTQQRYLEAFRKLTGVIAP